MPSIVIPFCERDAERSEFDIPDAVFFYRRFSVFECESHIVLRDTTFLHAFQRMGAERDAVEDRPRYLAVILENAPAGSLSISGSNSE